LVIVLALFLLYDNAQKKLATFAVTGGSAGGSTAAANCAPGGT
jgi:hypothetical protein